MRVLFTGGGTGGHLFPIVATARELKRLADEERILGLELFYVGPDDFGSETLKEAGIVPVFIASGKLRRYFSLDNFTDVLKITWGTVQALWNVFLIMPDVVFSKGGYGALPAVIASAVFRIPLFIHESDAIPGRVNRFSAKFAVRIGIAFRNAVEYFLPQKTAWVGIPIRKRVLGGNRKEARDEFDIMSDLPVVAFLGASQGAQKINETVLAVLKDLTEEFEILHQTGKNNFEEVKGEAGVILEFSHKERYHPFGFLDEDAMREFYAAADLVVARAGASSIFEIAAWAKPSILIPLRNAAQDHQRKNAYEYGALGATVVIEETNLTPHVLLAEIKKVLGDPELMKRMSEAAQKFSRIDSAEIIAREILKLGGHS